MIVLKTIGAAVMMTGAIALAAVGVGSGVASAAPGMPGTPWQQDDNGWGWGHGGHGHWGHDWEGPGWDGDGPGWGPGWGWGAPCVSAPFVQACA
jgi:hypothetical protein